MKPDRIAPGRPSYLWKLVKFRPPKPVVVPSSAKPAFSEGKLKIEHSTYSCIFSLQGCESLTCIVLRPSPLAVSRQAHLSNPDEDASLDQSLLSPSSSLSVELRARTASLHDEAEALLGLPDSIASGSEYADWLGHFLAFYAPLEQAIDAHPGWDVLEPFSAGAGHSQRLIRDLSALGFARCALTHIQNAPRPALQTFAQALGARYVLEGSMLGAKVILRDLQARIGPEIEGATAFFGGGDTNTGSSWGTFKLAVNRFGELRPECREDVLKGAEWTFRALLDWFQPFAEQKRIQIPVAGRKGRPRLKRAVAPTHLSPAGDLG